MHRHFLFFFCGTLVVLCLQFLHTQQPKQDQVTQQARKQTAQKLAEAMRSEDESAVRKLAAESAIMLGDLAGVPEVADEYRQALAARMNRMSF
jgi:23S rRNA A1618 N6-methylase RlmF